MKGGEFRTIFRWRPLDSSGRRMFLSFLIVTGLFLGVGSVIRVTVAGAIPEPGRWGSLLYVPDDSVGRKWVTQAIEAGPFPIPIAGADEAEDDRGVIGGIGRVMWGDYESEMRERGVGGEEEDLEMQGLAVRGVRFLPERQLLVDETRGERGRVVRKPVVLPVDDSDKDVMPFEGFDFQGEIAAETSSADWRFLVRCRADGSVEHCIPLFRIAGDDGWEVMEWLGGLVFEVSGKSRWIAVRVDLTSE